MTELKKMTAGEAVERLRRGNAEFVASGVMKGDVSPNIRAETVKNGQSPYAVIVSCSDSRVIPEAIFSAGIGELFVIRAAGNVVGDHELGSIEYAVSHLGCSLVVIMGHTHCGAVHSAVNDEPHGYVGSITKMIADAARGVKDESEVCRQNVACGVKSAAESLGLSADIDGGGAAVIGAIYDTELGSVEFIL